MIRKIGLGVIICMNLSGFAGWIYLVVLAFMGDVSGGTAFGAFACWVACNVFMQKIVRDVQHPVRR